MYLIIWVLVDLYKCGDGFLDSENVYYCVKSYC